MSKRHQASRRRSYGRRQHELRERSDRRSVAEIRDGAWDTWDSASEDAWGEPATGSPSDPLGFLDARTSAVRFALGD